MNTDRLDLGDTIVFRGLSYSEITTQSPSIQELSKLISSFNFREVLITLIRIGLAFSRSDDVEERTQTESILREAFYSPFIQSQNPSRGYIYGRFAVLRLLLESCRISQPDSTRNLVEADERRDLGLCVFMMNDFLFPKVDRKPLFSLSSDLSELNNPQSTPEELRIDLENNVLVPDNALLKLLISPDSNIRSAEVGKHWQVEDGMQLYSVVKAKGRINVFDGVVERKHLLVDAILIYEYSDKYHNIPEKMVRSKEILSLAQDSAIDMKVKFFEATGLELETYKYLIFHSLVNYLRLKWDDVLHGENLFISSRPQHLEDLYDKLLKHNSISIDQLPNEIYNSLMSTPMNEFHVFRDKPLVKTAEDQIICVDFNFLADKLESGVFWIILDQLKESERGQLFSIWGTAFEKYVGSILKRSMPITGNETENSMEVAESFIPSPRYKENPRDECTDFIIHTDESLILMECKVARLTADAKYNGKFHDLERELKEKCVAGIVQLRTAILTLANRNEGDRHHIEGVDFSRIRKIYPVLVVLEDIFSAQWMNWYLNRQLRLILKPASIRPNLQVAPLSVLTSSDLEHLEPYLTDIPFHVHLDNWIEIYQQNQEISAFRSYLHTMRTRDSRSNQFIEHKFGQIKSEMLEFFKQRGLDRVSDE